MASKFVFTSLRRKYIHYNTFKKILGCQDTLLAEIFYLDILTV